MTASDEGRGSSGLLGRLPAEVLNQVFYQLHNIDLKTLRQTCTYIKDATHLRLNRLFLSPNFRDIEVFRAVADHETFRFQVTEIIYDDARFDPAHEMEWPSWYDQEDDIGEVTGVPEWYRHVYRQNRGMIRRYKPHHSQVKEAFEHLLSPAEAFKHFKRLWQEQQETIATNGDADALSRIIAQHLRENPESKLAHLAVDTNQLRTGISCRMFDDAENSEIKDLNTILSHPGFAGLDLSLHCGNQCNMNWCSFRSHHLRNTLASARDIQHFSLFTNIVYVDDFDDSDDSDGEKGDHFISLHSIFPVNDWHQLRHFGLSRFIVKKDNVIKFLRALPPTLESVELSFFIFMPDSDDYHSLVHDMHEKLGWRERDAENQPKIVIRIDVRFAKVHGAVMIDISQEVTSFMYQNGENPFEQDEGCVEDSYIPQSDTPQGNGRLLDAFDPSFEEPNVSRLVMQAG
ncbi:hypothetical protein ACJA88_001202 [Fusarium oxysporum]